MFTKSILFNTLMTKSTGGRMKKKLVIGVLAVFLLSGQALAVGGFSKRKSFNGWTTPTRSMKLRKEKTQDRDRKAVRDTVKAFGRVY